MFEKDAHLSRCNLFGRLDCFRSDGRKEQQPSYMG
jgi:hypothetical protein